MVVVDGVYAFVKVFDRIAIGKKQKAQPGTHGFKIRAIGSDYSWCLCLILPGS